MQLEFFQQWLLLQWKLLEKTYLFGLQQFFTLRYGIVEPITAAVSISLTLSTLLAVNSMLAGGAELDEKQLIQSEFRRLYPKS